MAAAEEMVFATQGAKAQEVVARALAAPVSLAADQVREVNPGRSQAGEVWSPQLLPYQSWEGGSARAGQVDGDADGDLLAAGSLGMGVDDDARARLLAMAARQEGVGGSAAVDVPDEQDAPAVSVQREETGYALRADLGAAALDPLPQAGFSSTGLTDETVQVVFAQVERVADAQPEPSELIEPFLLPIADVPCFLAENDTPIGTRAQLVLEAFARRR